MKARAAGQSTLLLLDVVQIVVDAGIHYAVIGALAAAVHGSIRATTDADALVSVTASELGRLEKLLRKAGFTTELRRGQTHHPIPALLAVTDRHGNRVDLLAGLRGLDPLAFSRNLAIAFHGTNLNVIGREDFIAMKCFAGEPLGLADALQVLKTHEAPVDIDLLRRVTRRFGRAAADTLEELLNRDTA
jgi:predicted nucleotidyltransferase